MEKHTNMKPMTDELALIAYELYNREFSNNGPRTNLQAVSWDELCNKAILLAAKLKTQKEVDLELCHKDSHYSYCNTVYDLIEDALYVESLPDEED